MSVTEIAYRLGWTLFIVLTLVSLVCLLFEAATKDDDWRDYAIVTAIFAFAGLLMIVVLYIWTGAHEGISF